MRALQSLSAYTVEGREGGRDGRREGWREGGMEGGREGERERERQFSTALSSVTDWHGLTGQNRLASRRIAIGPTDVLNKAAKGKQRRRVRESER